MLFISGHVKQSGNGTVKNTKLVPPKQPKIIYKKRRYISKEDIMKQPSIYEI